MMIVRSLSGISFWPFFLRVLLVILHLNVLQAGTTPTTSMTTLSKSVQNHSLSPGSSSCTPHPTPSPGGTQSNDSCVVGVLAPVDLHSYGLVNNQTFCSTLDRAREAAQAILNSTCNVEVYVTFTRCTLRSVLLVALGDFFLQGDSVMIGPPCSTPANIISLLGKPVITWVPLHVNLGLEDEARNQDWGASQGQTEGGLAISSFGSYQSLAKSVISTLKHFNWSKIAILYSEDEFCGGFHGVVSGLVNNLMTAYHFGFDHHNLTALNVTLDTARTKSRIIVTCTHPDVFNDLMTSAAHLKMTSGDYVIIHVNLGTRLATDGVYKYVYLKKNLVSTVLFVGHFGDRCNRTVAHSNTSAYTSSDGSGQFLDYFHDAILLWAAARNRTGPGQKVSFANLTLTEYSRTGKIHLDHTGVRHRHHCLLHYQDGHLEQIADLDNGQYKTLRNLSWPNGAVPSDQFQSLPEENKDNSDEIVGGVLGAIFIVLVLLVAAFLFRRWRLDRFSRGRAWQVEDRDVKRRHNYMTSQTGNNQQRRLMRMETRGTLGLGSICSLDRNQLFAPVGSYRGMPVVVKTIHNKSFRLTTDLVTDLNILKELNHDNINTFVGAHIEPGNSYVLFKYCSKGSLQDVLENEDITLDWMFKMSFVIDLARGMGYLHKSTLRSHGNLKSTNCVIDSRWVLKVTDFGVVSTPGDEHDDEMTDQAICNSLLWTAPELLRLEEVPRKGTQRGDVFSFAIVLQEVLFRVGPYGYDSNTPEEIIENVKKGKNPPFRPHIPENPDVSEKALNLMTSCWEESPEQRPELSAIRKRLFELNGGKKVSVVDNMLSLMETYSSRLEQLVADRTEELAQEKVKTDRLLYQMLPQSVAEQLKSGKAVIPEFYDAVSIFFSDIVGFTNIASQSKPLEVVDLLNDLYTAFDDVIFRRDVYKVETIGDAYMCVSGCPRRNGPRHASEIAEMALDLISTVIGVKVRHRPTESLQLRIGLHTGPCAAGVVGVAMPRYCLFGDTVNMASRMESTGKALHIHISSEVHEALEELNCGFLTLERGMIQVKGKGIHKTYWLVGKEGYNKPLPETFSKLRQTLDEANSRPPSPSVTSLTVGDGMYSALRKTSLAVSQITVTSDSDDGSIFQSGSIVRSESGVDTTFPGPRKQRSSNETCVSVPSITQNDDACNENVKSRKQVVTIVSDDPKQQCTIPRIEIS